MVYKNVYGNPAPLIDDSKSLQCPSCGDNYLHQGEVRVMVRQEDSKGTLVTVPLVKDPLKLSSFPDPVRIDNNPKDSDYVGRRQHIDIDFWCEHCSQGSEDIVGTLRVAQHKGMTFVTWANL